MYAELTGIVLYVTFRRQRPRLARLWAWFYIVGLRGVSLPSFHKPLFAICSSRTACLFSELHLIGFLRIVPYQTDVVLADHNGSASPSQPMEEGFVEDTSSHNAMSLNCRTIQVPP